MLATLSGVLGILGLHGRPVAANDNFFLPMRSLASLLLLDSAISVWEPHILISFGLITGSLLDIADALWSLQWQLGQATTWGLSIYDFVSTSLHISYILSMYDISEELLLLILHVRRLLAILSDLEGWIWVLFLAYIRLLGETALNQREIRHIGETAICILIVIISMIFLKNIILAV